MPVFLRNAEPVGFEWDGAKATGNFSRHAIAFAAATLAFRDPARVTLDATRVIDGEARERVIATIEDVVASVIYILPGDGVRIISARPASRRERRLYDGDRPLPA